MTQLANAFIYYGLIAGYYGQATADLIPHPNQVLPERVSPRMKIFHSDYASIDDYIGDLPPIGTLNPFFQTLKDLKDQGSTKVIAFTRKLEREADHVPF